MPTQKRWPKNAESARSETAELAREIAALANKARGEIKRNPLLTELMLADIMANAERIQRLMVEAKNGRDDHE